VARRVPAEPLLPGQLEPRELPYGEQAEGELTLAGALVERHGRDAIVADRLRVDESELRGLTLGEGVVRELALGDTRLLGCDLSNVRARGATMRRVELIDSRLVGFAMSEGRIEDARVVGGTMMLGSLAHSRLERVVFENVNLREASFMEARLESVVFDGCELEGTDFRGVRLKDCTIRGSSLDGVVGVESLSGLTMPWGDLVESAGALGSALGIAVETE
jgi:uncharacterized protein YjbI with pentapeptide repeats